MSYDSAFAVAHSVSSSLKAASKSKYPLPGKERTGGFNYPYIPAKLTVGSPDNPYEREADTMADRVMHMPEPNFVQRKCAECEREEELQRKPLSHVATPFLQAKNETTVSDGVANAVRSSKGGGSTLGTDINSFMSDRFGYDFGSVKIHTDRRSVQLNQNLNARAFTVGNDV